jgi:predicted DNA repair protein MutK
MASGLFALLDDIAAIAKMAAASLDDVAAQALKAGKKSAGIVIDDAAVTPRYVVGFAAERELPIITKIAWGSLKNKVLYLLPGALLLSYLAPWAITPLLMAGGAYLCFEGWEKVQAMLQPAPALAAGAVEAPPSDKKEMSEDEKVASAIRTDFILSAEIMAITLAAVETPGFWSKAATLALVGLVVTIVVYGSVALIVKADDVGLHLAQKGRLAIVRSLGSGIVHAMPGVLKALAFIGMLAMLWVGGGIILHGLSEYGLGYIPKGIHAWAASVGQLFGTLNGFVTWLLDATAAGIFGLALGAIVAWGVALVAPRNSSHG